MRALGHYNLASCLWWFGLVACTGPRNLALALAPAGSTATVRKTRTCPHSCKEGAPDSPAPAEVFGPDSRCFETRILPPGGAGDRECECLQVTCNPVGGDGTGYVITLSDGAEAVCSDIGAYVTALGWQGEIHCDERDQVCDAAGDVLMAPEEGRRVNVSEHLYATYDATTAEALLSHYDNGEFDPHPPAEDGIEGEFLIDHGGSTCEWGGTALAGLQKVELSKLGFIHFRQVGPAALLQAISHSCSGYVEQALRVRTFHYAETEGAPYGIDSLDGSNPLDGKYRRFYGGAGVKVFVLDTGIDRDHEELAGRVDPGADFTGSNSGSGDVHGHGTHVAGTIAGTTVGVAPQATVVPVKVLGDDGVSTGTSMFEGLEYVLDYKQTVGGPMVLSGSLGGARSQSTDRAWRSLVNSGVTAVVAAGNDDERIFFASPANEPGVITVGAIDINHDPASFSNYGSLMDIWAPGVNIRSARAGGGYSTLSGTSMACPHVTGVAALLLEGQSNLTPDEVGQIIMGDCAEDIGGMKASTGLILRTNAGPPPTGNSSSACILAFGEAAPTQAPTEAPTTTVEAAPNGGTTPNGDGSTTVEAAPNGGTTPNGDGSTTVEVAPNGGTTPNGDGEQAVDSVPTRRYSPASLAMLVLVAGQLGGLRGPR